MSHTGRRKFHDRRFGFEACEPRLMMTAQTEPDFRIDYLIGGPGADGQITTAFELSAESLTSAHQQTGLDLVRQQYGFDGSGQTVAVIDTGIAYNHYALGGGFGSGYRVVGGWDVTEWDANPYDDTGAHGTHVAGIIGSSDPNNLGVAPGVDLVALRVFDDAGYGYFSWVETALQWVYSHRNDFRNPITTVNLSLGAEWNSSDVPPWAMLEDEFRALEQVGIFISVAAGNSFGYYNTPGLSYPAASPYVVAALSTDPNGSLSYFSQRLDRAIAAPGASIRSTVPDYAGNRNGLADDFATYSGTSMAAPYLAGAAVILRQALQQAGRTSINQDMIYQLMRDTADRIYDAVTNAYYLRLNVKRAVDTVSTDVEGSSRDTAVKLGTLDLHKEFSGIVDYEGDRDYFKFTAKRAGAVTVTLNSPEGMSTRLHVIYSNGSSTAVDGNVLTFSVKAGATYIVRVQGLDATGSYEADIQLTPKATNLGTLTGKTLNKQKVSGEKWYRFDAATYGDLTVKGVIKNRTGDVTLRLYDSDLNHLGTSTGRYTDQLEAGVLKGETYYLLLSGKNSNVKLQFSTVISQPASLTGASTSGVSRASFDAQGARASDAEAFRLSALALEAVGSRDSPNSLGRGRELASDRFAPRLHSLDRLFGEADVARGEVSGFDELTSLGGSSAVIDWVQLGSPGWDQAEAGRQDAATEAGVTTEGSLDSGACDYLLSVDLQSAA